MDTQSIKKKALFDALPEQRNGDFLSDIRKVKQNLVDSIIVLDDDPTGTQTVHNVPVLTQWDIESIVNEFQKESPLFFILTNSRSLTEEEAKELAKIIGRNIQLAAEKTGKRFWIVSRSDSTLRGHYPSEVKALEEGLGWKEGVHIIIPAFFEGGRYSINNIHYVQDEDELIPAAQTPFAQDKVFGFCNSDLKEWVIEKNKSKIDTEDITTISIEELRIGSLDDLIIKLNEIKKGSVCVVNATDYQDLHFFALAILKATIDPIFRTAASFVTALSGKNKIPLLSGSEIKNSGGNGGLIVVGSYVPTSSSQLYHLLTHLADVQSLEIEVEHLLKNKNKDALRQKYTQQIDDFIQHGQTVVLYTSRTLVSAESEEKNQEIGKIVSHFITQVITYLKNCPSYLLTKGGITSSDIATKSLGIKRALVKGQIMNGVPVWELGLESKFPGSHQIIFPGNVGTKESLTEIVKKLMH